MLKKERSFPYEYKEEGKRQQRVFQKYVAPPSNFLISLVIASDPPVGGSAVIHMSDLIYKKIYNCREWVANFYGRHQRLIRFFIIVLFAGVSFAILYKDFTFFSTPSMEIRQICNNTDSRGTCERKFDVSIYLEEFEKEVEKIYKTQTIAQKLSGASPLLFRYSVGFRDNSFWNFWVGQHRHTQPRAKEGRGICKFPEGFIEEKSGGRYKKSFSINNISEKVRELAVTLNDCQQPLVLTYENIAQLEGVEKYDIFVKLSWLSYISIGILSLVLAGIGLSIWMGLYQFCKYGCRNRTDIQLGENG